MNTSKTIVQKASGSVKWSALMEMVSRAASPIVFLILARLLTPEDFGVVAIATIVINFSQMFWEAGLGRALIQTKEQPEQAADVVFWTNIVLGLIVYTIIFFSAPWVATYFNSLASLPILRVLGLQVIIVSLTSVQQALFVRELGFRQLFWIKLATAFVPGLFSIPLAFSGYGAWALVAGSLAGSLLNLVLLWKQSTWRPRLRFDWRLAQSLFSFGGWVVLESFGGWFLNWGDNLLVGKFLGADSLGVYVVGWNISLLIFGLSLNAFLPVLYPTFSRLQDDVQTLKTIFHKVNRVVISLALPMGVGLLLTGPQVASVLFGDKWQGLGLVLSVIGFMHGMTWLIGVNSELYRAMGRPDVNTKLMFAAILYYLPAYLIAAPFGLEVFVFARLGVALVAIPLHIYLCVHMLEMSPLYLWQEGKPMILSTLVMAVVVAAVRGILTMSGLPEPVFLAILILAGGLSYSGTLWLLDRTFVVETINLLKRAALT